MNFDRAAEIADRYSNELVFPITLVAIAGIVAGALILLTTGIITLVAGVALAYGAVHLSVNYARVTILRALLASEDRPVYNQ